jgi:hypothetical protein
MSYSLGDTEFFEIWEGIDAQTEAKLPRMGHSEVNRRLRENAIKLNKDQRLVKSLIEQSKFKKPLSDEQFECLKDFYKLRRRHKTYLRLKRFLPMGIIAPFTGTELSKMGYAIALGSKSVPISLSGVIGYSLPAFFFWHMSYYYDYAPDRLKPICQIGKILFGGPLWVTSAIVDEFMSGLEEKLFAEQVPLDLPNYAGTVPSDMGSLEELNKLVSDMMALYTQKTY